MPRTTKLRTAPDTAMALTLGACVVVAVAFVAVLAVAAREHAGPARLDPVTAADVLGLRTSAVTVLARLFTFIGSEVVVGAVALVLFGWLLWRRDLERATPFAVAMAGSAFLTIAVKLIVARPRPGRVDVLGAVDHSYSFPSGHTLNTTVLTALVIWLLWAGASNLARVLLVGAGALFALAVAASRVYLGYHWLTDVAASLLLALAWLGALYLGEPLLRPLAERARRLPGLRR